MFINPFNLKIPKREKYSVEYKKSINLTMEAKKIIEDVNMNIGTDLIDLKLIKASELLDKAINLDFGCYMAHRFKGDISYINNDIHGILFNMQRAVANTPCEDEDMKVFQLSTRITLSNTYSNVEDYKNELIQLRNIINILEIDFEPNKLYEARTRRQLMSCLLENNLTNEAVQQMKLYIDKKLINYDIIDNNIYDGDNEYLNLLGSIALKLKEEGNFEESIDILISIITQTEDEDLIINSQLNLASCLSELHLFDNSKEVIDILLKKQLTSTKLSNALFILGKCSEYSSDKDDNINNKINGYYLAIKYFNKCFELNDKELYNISSLNIHSKLLSL
jgi:tetratricopeptide (TPR) repeat protein